MTTRRAFLLRATAAAAGGVALVALRDRVPWPPLDIRFTDGRGTPWRRMDGRGSLVEIDASVNGRPVRAVIDSGAQITAVDAGLAQALDLPRILAAPLLAYGVSGGPRLTHKVRLDLGVTGLRVGGLRAAVLDLAAVAGASGRAFQVLIGRDVLDRVVLDADLPFRRARLLSPAAYRPAHDARTIPLSGGAPRAQVRIEDSPPLDLLVDTGASSHIALSQAAARRVGLTAPGRRTSQGLSVSLGGLHPEINAVARTVRLGPLTLHDVPVQIYSPAATAPSPSGLIGMGLLNPFRVSLNLPARRLDLTPPPLLVMG